MFRLIILNDDKVIQDIETEAIAAAVDDAKGGGCRSILMVGQLSIMQMLAVTLVLDEIKDKVLRYSPELSEVYSMKEIFNRSKVGIDVGMLMKLLERREDEDG